MLVQQIDLASGSQSVVDEPERQSPVPEVVSMRQARLALLGAGLLGNVDAAIASLPSPQREAARIEWEYATEIRRDSPTMGLIGAALSLTSEQIDALFVDAASK